MKVLAVLFRVNQASLAVLMETKTTVGKKIILLVMGYCILCIGTAVYKTVGLLIGNFVNVCQTWDIKSYCFY